MNRRSLLSTRNQERSALDCTAGEVTFDDLQIADPPLSTASDLFMKRDYTSTNRFGQIPSTAKRPKNPAKNRYRGGYMNVGPT